MTITGMILAGGRGSRMDNLDKGLQPLAGLPMARRVLDRLAPQVDKMAINANRNLKTYEHMGVPVWPDDMREFAGPLAGFQTGLIHCETRYLATAPCDSPFVPLDLVAKLREGLTSADADLAFAVSGSGAARQPQPVFCLMKTSLQPNLTQFLRRGGRKVEVWYATLNAVEVHFADESAFSNINTLDDLQRFQERQ